MGDTFRNLRSLDPMRRRKRAVAPQSAGAAPTGSGDDGDSMVDCAIYRDGERVASPRGLHATMSSLREAQGSLAWIGLYRPTQSDLEVLGEEFSLHELAVEDAILAHQRPKLERYDDTLFVVLRAARYLDATEEVEFGEVHLFVSPDHVITVRHSEAPDLASVRTRLERDPDLLELGGEAILYAVMDTVVDEYAPVVAGLANDIDEIETEVFSGDPQVSRRIYQLTREVIEFQRAAEPLVAMFDELRDGFEKYGTNEELRRNLRDVEDHVLIVVEHLTGFREMLRDMLTVNATLVAQEQNEEMRLLSISGHAQNEEFKKISSWAAILFAPTVIGGIYGMNFDDMPETHWSFGYPMALVMMFLASVALYLIFKRRGWL